MTEYRASLDAAETPRTASMKTSALEHRLELLESRAQLEALVKALRTEPTAVAVSSWAADPWTEGAYTHIPPGASPADADLLGEPVGGRLLFAGEHTQSARLAYADGALTSGIREAKRLLGTPAVRIWVNHASQGD